LPSEETHVQQACHNRRLARTISRSDYPDWAATVIFYAAVHYVEAVLARHAAPPDDQPSSHADRMRAMNNDLRHFTKRVRRCYRRLLDKSHDARYEDWRSLGGFAQSDISALYLGALVPLAREMRKALRQRPT
jgi:hypothetical protein